VAELRPSCFFWGGANFNRWEGLAPQAPLVLAPATSIIAIVIIFLVGTQFPVNEKLRYAIKKYKNQAGMNLTGSTGRAVRWHYTAESKRRVAEIKS